MSGLVEELRAVRRKLRGSHWSEHVRFGLFSEAADEIASLRASAREIDRLMLVIESAVRNADPARPKDVLAALKANRSALLPKEPDHAG